MKVLWHPQTLCGLLQATAERVTVAQISGAMTNLVYRCGYDTPSKVGVHHSKKSSQPVLVLFLLLLCTTLTVQDKFATPLTPDMTYYALLQKYHALARVFGSAGGLFGREDEQQVFSAVADAGLGPRVLVSESLMPMTASCPNPSLLRSLNRHAAGLHIKGFGMQVLFAEGRIEEFIEAQSVSAELMATPEVAVSIAAAMAHFHFSMLKHFTMLDHLPSCMSPVAQIWDRLRDWARIGTELYKPEELQQYNLGNIRQEVSLLRCTVRKHAYICSQSAGIA